MNNYHRNDRRIYASVLDFEPKRHRTRELRAAAARLALYAGIVVVLGACLWYVCFGVVVQG